MVINLVVKLVDEALAGAVVELDALLEFKWIKDDDIEKVKEIRKDLHDKISSPRIRYEIRMGLYKLWLELDDCF